VASAGPAGPVLFAGAYALAVALLVPAAPLTLLAGALFGPVVGTAVVSAGATTGATLAFLLARGAAAPALEKVLAGKPAWDQARSALSAASASGTKLVFLLRLSPLIPFSLSNYALGALTDVRTGLSCWGRGQGRSRGQPRESFFLVFPSKFFSELSHPALSLLFLSLSRISLLLFSHQSINHSI